MGRAQGKSVNGELIALIDARQRALGLKPGDWQSDRIVETRGGLSNLFIRNIRRGSSRSPRPDSLALLAKGLGVNEATVMAAAKVNFKDSLTKFVSISDQLDNQVGGG